MSLSRSAEAPRILIVDDEPTNIAVLAEVLAGYELCFANDGATALALAVEHSPDLILLDVMMPGMSGFEVLRWFKSEPRTEHIPVIFVTSLDEAEDEERGLNLGAVDYIVKPIRPAIARARVRTHIELKRQRDLLEEHAAIDGLTQIANHHRFDLELARAWRSVQRSGQSLTVMLLDIDHFGRFNTEYGQSPGDECLRRVASALDHAFARGHDMVARYGQDEFALLFDGNDGASQVRRVLEAIYALEISHQRSDCSMFVSVSAGALTTLASSDVSPEKVMEKLKLLLQDAKLEGGNRGEALDLRNGVRSTVQLPEPSGTVDVTTPV